MLSRFSFGQYVSRYRRDIAPFGLRFADSLSSLTRENLLNAHHRLQSATLTCKLLMDVLREPVADGVQCFAYIDVPYPIQHKTPGTPLYEYSMLTYDEHITLFNMLATLPYPFMLSYSKGWFTDLMLKRTGFRCEEIPYKWTGTRRSTHPQGEELIITNYDPPVPSKDVCYPVRGSKSTAVVPAAITSWADAPSIALRASIDGIPFNQLPCCDKERIVLRLGGKDSGRCRICANRLSVLRK